MKFNTHSEDGLNQHHSMSLNVPFVLTSKNKKEKKK